MSDETTSLDTIAIQELLELLPHRYPFLMVDRIVDIEGDLSARGIKNVTYNEPHFLGHFPSQPIMPGVLIIEGMAQTAGAVCAREHFDNGPSIVYFMTIDKAKFRRIVEPGDRVEYVVRKMKQRKDIFKYDCHAEVDGKIVAEAQVGAMMVRADG